MEKYSLFSGLTGLVATKLRLGNGNALPSTGAAGDWLKSGDIVLFSLTSDDLWLSVELQCPAVGIVVLFDAKVSFSLKMLKLRALIFEYATSLLRARGQDPGYTLNCFRLRKKPGQKSLSISCDSPALEVLREMLVLEDSGRIGDYFDYLGSYTTSTLEVSTEAMSTCPIDDAEDKPEALSPLFPVRKLKVAQLAALESPRKSMKRSFGASSQTCKGCAIF